MSAAHSQPRRAGRPGTSDDPQVRERLVDAAEQLFTERGFAATPVRAVAETAGVNPALVSYYFGGKHALLGAVFERSLDPLMRDPPALTDGEVASILAFLEALTSPTARAGGPVVLIKKEGRTGSNYIMAVIGISSLAYGFWKINN